MKAQPAVPAGYGTLHSSAFGFDEGDHARTLASDVSDPTPKAQGDPEPDEPEFHPEDLVPVKVNGDSEEPVDESTPIRFSWRTLWAYTGPGFLMSIAYLDPGNLESDLQAGAQTGYQLIWVLFWATVLGWLFQILSVRLGVITGKDLAQVCRHEYPRPVAMCVWIMTEIAIIGADIQEVVGSAIALNILFGLPLYGGVLITAFDTFTFMFLHYFGVRKLEAFFGFLIALMAMCFAVQFGIGGPDGAGIMKGWVVPTVDSGSLIPAVGMLGAVIMPHNMFLHSALVQSRKVDRTSKRAVREAIMYFTIEAAISLAISFVINMMVVAVFAKGFYSSGNPNTDIGLHEAGDQLEAVFGKAARIFWAIGLLAAGQSSTMTGTFAGQYVMQGFLNMRIAQWIRTGITRSVALVPALIVALAATNNMDNLDEYINVLQSIQLPFALLPVLVFNCSTHIMSEDFIIPRKYRYPLAFLVVMVIGTNVYLVVSFMQTNISTSPVAYFLLSVFFLLHFRLSQSVARTANLFQFIVIGGMGLAVFQGLLHAFVLIAESAELKDRCVAINYLEFVGQNAIWFIVQSWALLQAAMLSAQLSRTVDVANALYACELLTRHHVSIQARSPAHLPDVPETDEAENSSRPARMPSLRNITASGPAPPTSAFSSSSSLPTVPRVSSAPSSTTENTGAGEFQSRISPPKKPQSRPHVLGQKRAAHAPLYLGLPGSKAPAARGASSDQCSVYNFNACPPQLQHFISMHEEGQAPIAPSSFGAVGGREAPSLSNYQPQKTGQRITTRGDLGSDLHRPLLPDSEPSDHHDDPSEHYSVEMRRSEPESGHDWAFGAPAFGPISDSNGGELNWATATGRSSPHALSPEQSMSCLLSPHDLSIHNSWQAFLLYLTARSSQGVVMFGVTVDLQLLYRMIAVAVPVGLVAAQRYLGSVGAEEE